MENTDPNATSVKPNSGVLKIVIWFAVFLLFASVIGVSFWYAFYSVKLANDPLLIPLRNTYQNVYWKVMGLVSTSSKDYPPFPPIYIIQPQKALEPNSYTYTLVGQFYSLDVEGIKKYISIKAADNKIYIFRIDKFILEDEQRWIKIIQVANIEGLASATDSGNSTAPKQPGTKYSQILLQFDTPLAPIKTIGIRWNDQRNLDNLWLDYWSNPEAALNEKNPGSVFIGQFN